MEGSNPVKSFGPAKGLNASKFFDRIRFRDVAALVGAIAVLLLAMGISSVSYKLHKESTEALDNHARVEENSELTYYLTVNEDGVDSTGKQSSDTVTANISGGMTSVTDRLPDGLEFVGFVTTEDGTIGAAARSDSSIACGGHVIDDTKEEKVDGGTWNSDRTEYYYHGLHYNASTRTVSFRVENVQAGCGLTVGIVTKTPSLGTNKRLDFYNTASLNEGALNLNSNTMHTWMGRNGLTDYSVTYAYTGDVPASAPAAPEEQKYVDGANVAIAPSPIVEGYQFSGWTTSDTETELGHFTMPASNVAFTGSFTEKPAGTKYNVTYVIDGTAPENYVVPKAKQYEAGTVVKLDSTSKGSILDKYVFSGWSTEDTRLDENGFVMPAKNVEIHGSFSERTYTVSYQFEGEVMPPNASALLPEAQEYVPGTKVTRAPNPTANGYAFTGWYKNESFIMPEEDVVIYGEWSIQNGVFSPEISKKITNPMKKYGLGDTVKFEITVKNTAGYPIKDVQVLEQLDGAVFQQGSGYTIRTDNYALIPKLDAGQSLKLYAVYEVQSGDDQHLTNTAKIAGALADNNYNLDTTKEYLATAEFDTTLNGIPYDDGKDSDADNANTLDKIAHYTILGLVAIAGTIASVFMIRRTLKNGQLQTLAPKAKTGLQGLKNIFNPNTATKGRLIAFATADLALVAVAAGLIVKLNLPQKLAENADPTTISFMSGRADYDAGEGGAWKITKSAKWTGDGKAQLTIDLDTVAKNANGKYTDVLFVVDVSGSMSGAKLDRVKQDMTELTDSLMSNSQNQVAMVSFESGAKKELDFTTDKTAAQTAIDNLGTSGCTNYYQAFKEAEGILENYQTQDNRELFLLFLTDGYPNEDTPNEQAEYSYLKSAYPSMVINAIQYEMASEILDPIKAISDNQYIADMDTLNNVLFEASRAPYIYDTLNIEDVIDTRYFEVNNGTSVEALNSSLGTAELTEEGGSQKVRWNMDGLLRSGQSAKLTINLKLKGQYKRVGGEYPTNQTISANTNLPEVGEDNKSSTETPVLKNYYNVIYEANSPSDCTVENMPNSPERHFVYETVEISETVPTCAGYNFAGFSVLTNSAKILNDDYFLMPDHDVIVRAKWEKSSIEKRMDGTLFSAKTLYKTIAQLTKGIDSFIDFGELSSSSNGNGVYTLEESVENTFPVYYYRGNIADNNVLFAGFCWKAVRTTDTGGVKLLYAGIPSNTNECGNIDYSFDSPNTSISRTKYNEESTSPAYVGYMYGDIFYPKRTTLTSEKDMLKQRGFYSDYYFGNGVTWSASTKKYTLSGYRKGSDISSYPDVVGKYAFGNDWATTNSSADYIVKVTKSYSSAEYTYYYIPLRNGNLLEDVNEVYTYGDSYADNGDGTYTILNPTSVDTINWYDNGSLTHKFYCENAIEDTCENLKYAANASLHTLRYYGIENKIRFSGSFTYSDGKYYLNENGAVDLWYIGEDDDVAPLLSNAHYTCFNDSGVCDTLAYIYYKPGDTFYYLELQNGDGIEDAIRKMNTNNNDSIVKAAIDQWYENNLLNTDEESLIEDTIYCNDRSLDETNSFNPGGGEILSGLIKYGAYRRIYDGEGPSLECADKNDSFSVSEEIGNGNLKYPIGILTADELVYGGHAYNKYMYYKDNYLFFGGYNSTMSPLGFYRLDTASVYVGSFSTYGLPYTSNSYPTKPVISIKPGTYIFTGDGSASNPWELEAP